MPPTDRLVELTLRGYTDRLASGDPVPGGGSAAALTGGLAAALAGMVARLTIGRQEYVAHANDVQRILAQADRLQSQMLALVDADTAAYGNLLAAYRLPKRDEQESSVRQSAIQETLRHATDIPLATAEACVQILNLAAEAKEHGNKNAAGDANVAALLAHASMLGSIHNVRLNLQRLRDIEFCAETEARVTGLATNGEAALRRALGS